MQRPGRSATLAARAEECRTLRLHEAPDGVAASSDEFGSANWAWPFVNPKASTVPAMTVRHVARLRRPELAMKTLDMGCDSRRHP